MKNYSHNESHFSNDIRGEGPVSPTKQQPAVTLSGWYNNHNVLLKSWIDKLLEKSGLVCIGVPKEGSPAHKFLNLIDETYEIERERWLHEPKPQNVTSEEKLRISDDNICPVTKLPCEDECCPPGSICNLSPSELTPATTSLQSVEEAAKEYAFDVWGAVRTTVEDFARTRKGQRSAEDFKAGVDFIMARIHKNNEI